MKLLPAFVLVLLGAVTSVTWSAPARDSVTVNQPLQQELIRMAKEDQKFRSEWQAKMIALPESLRIRPSKEAAALMQEQEAVDRRNGARLDTIIAEHGWPGWRLVGKSASGAAFLIVQHADSSRQHRYLPLLKAAVAKGDADPMDAATLEDRVRVREGGKQIYGTQVHFGPETGGRWELYPIEDEEHVDDRRKAVGMPPIAEYLKDFGMTYVPPKKKQP
jgi:hypothetical protein